MQKTQCKNCGVALIRERKISFAKCSPCRKIESKNRYILGREEKIAYGKKRRIEKAEEIREKKRVKYLAQRSSVIKKVKEYYQENKIAVLERIKVYRENPVARERIRERNRIRSTLIRSIEMNSDITVDFILALKLEQKNCLLCSIELSNNPGESQRHLDHIIPLCIGGTHTKENVRYVCRNCNLRRPRDGSDI